MISALQVSEKELPCEEKIEEIHREMVNANLKRIQLATTMQKSMKCFVKTFQDGCLANLRRLEIDSMISEMKEELENSSEESSEAEKLLLKGSCDLLFCL